MSPTRQTKGQAKSGPAKAATAVVSASTSAKEGVTAPEVVSLTGNAEKPPTKPTAVEEKQEKTRGVIAGTLVALLFFIIIVSFASVWMKVQTVADVKALLEVILAPVVALVGSATGFYFGGKK